MFLFLMKTEFQSSNVQFCDNGNMENCFDVMFVDDESHDMARFVNRA